MPVRVLDVGQCDPDHASLRRMLEGKFSAQVVRVATGDEAEAEMAKSKFDLVLVNRKLDIDYSDGMDVVRRVVAMPEGQRASIMLVSNYPEYQEEAVKAGAAYGFGKAELTDARVQERLKQILAAK